MFGTSSERVKSRFFLKPHTHEFDRVAISMQAHMQSLSSSHLPLRHYQFPAWSNGPMSMRVLSAAAAAAAAAKCLHRGKFMRLG